MSGRQEDPEGRTKALRRLRGFAEGDKVYLLCCNAQRRLDQLGMAEILSAVVPSTFILVPVTVKSVSVSSYDQQVLVVLGHDQQVHAALGRDRLSNLETSHDPRFILTSEDVKLLPFPMRKP